ncbi:ATP-dependent RNA helicase DDX54/DBP10 [Nematocida sp. AWRm77]|nr:ATP-dependent RNA helicase DDX54/DBP10 [Nematocida sp. AWRm77]
MDFGIDTEVQRKESVTFKGMGIPIEIMSNIKYAIATPIQRKVIPRILQGEDIIAVSRTGSGKTFAYVIPILMKLLEKREKKDIYTRARAIIIVPTYELATQVFSVFLDLSSKGVHPAMFTGIGSLAHSFNYLVVGHFEVAICTPGRLEHMLTELSSAEKAKPIYLKVDEDKGKKDVSITTEQLLEKLTNPDIVVIDEMDRVFEDSSLSLSLERILEHFTNDPQYALFSATHHRGNVQIRSILSRKNIELVEVLGGVSEHLEDGRLAVNALFLQEDMKMAVLLSLIKKMEGEKMLIFVSTCKRALILGEALRQAGLAVGVLSSAESEESRELVLKSFKKDELSLLLSTDVGCRGLDIKGINAIVEYDYAGSKSTAVHRVGRMNRGKHEKGALYSFVRIADIPTYLAFLNHIHAEKPRDGSRQSRLCFTTDACIHNNNHSTCAYLGLGSVSRSFYSNAQELAHQVLRDSSDAGYSGSYTKYTKTNVPEKVDPHWIVTSVDVKNIPVHPLFEDSTDSIAESIKKYKSKYNPLLAPYTAQQSARKTHNRRAVRKDPVINLDRFKDSSFIPYENIKSVTFSDQPAAPKKTKEIRERVRKLARAPGQIFTEWTKENRDRLSKGYLLTRPAAEEKEENKPKQSDGATRTPQQITKMRAQRERIQKKNSERASHKSQRARK